MPWASCAAQIVRHMCSWPMRWVWYSGARGSDTCGPCSNPTRACMCTTCLATAPTTRSNSTWFGGASHTFTQWLHQQWAIQQCTLMYTLLIVPDVGNQMQVRVLLQQLIRHPRRIQDACSMGLVRNRHTWHTPHHTSHHMTDNAIHISQHHMAWH